MLKRLNVRMPFLCTILLLILMQFIGSIQCVVVEEPPSIPVEDEPIAPSSPTEGGTGGSSTFGYIPYAFTDTLGRHIDTRYCDLTPLSVDKTEFDKRCGSAPEAKGPCFSVHGDTSMATVTMEPWSAPLHMKHEVLLEDDRAVS